MVRDFTDFCFHSYFSYMDELGEEVCEDEKPMDIRCDNPDSKEFFIKSSEILKRIFLYRLTV